MKNILLASTSSLYGESYLDYLVDEIRELFGDANEIIFIPYARPGGISHDEYTIKAISFFAAFGIKVKGLHTCKDPVKSLKNAKGIFTGGGNTFLLVKQLHHKKLMKVLKEAVVKGTPYLGTSAGRNIAGVSMRTTNDMPIVQPTSFKCMGLVPFNINPHYLDPNPDLQHNGETRETRILEFLTQNKTPVIGLREGSWVRVRGKQIRLEGQHTARIFQKDVEPWEMKSGSEIKI